MSLQCAWFPENHPRPAQTTWRTELFERAFGTCAAGCGRFRPVRLDSWRGSLKTQRIRSMIQASEDAIRGSVIRSMSHPEVGHPQSIRPMRSGYSGHHLTGGGSDGLEDLRLAGVGGWGRMVENGPLGALCECNGLVGGLCKSFPLDADAIQKQGRQ